MVTKSEYRKLYQDRLPIGQRFQDHCTYVVQKELSLTLGNFQSKEYQYELGENAQGFEIKHDMKFEDTNNLWIEIEHRVHDQEPYYLGGIKRQDGAWLYCIGDYHVLYIFSKRFLCKLHETGKYIVIENNLKTSRGFLLPKEDAEKYYAYKINTPEGCIVKRGNSELYCKE